MLYEESIQRAGPLHVHILETTRELVRPNDPPVNSQRDNYYTKLSNIINSNQLSHYVMSVIEHHFPCSAKAHLLVEILLAVWTLASGFLYKKNQVTATAI